MTKHTIQYIPESWKRIIINITINAISPTYLPMLFCQWYVIFTLENTNENRKTSIKLHTKL
jgi:hypothetical protein